MARYSPLPEHLREALRRIEPSRVGDLVYFPCQVALRDGRVLSNVYIEPEAPYLRIWGIYPEDDRGKSWVRIEEVVAVEESPNRLPARFADQIYRQGESGMGYTIFTVVFTDGARQAFGTGNAIDFISYPEGKGPSDVSEVLPHVGRSDPSLMKAPHYYWCLYSEAS